MIGEFCKMKQQEIKISYSIFCIVFLLQGPAVFGQDIEHEPVRLSLNKAWERASAYNKEVAAQLINTKQGDEEFKDAKSKRLPSLQLGTSYTRFTTMTAFEDGLSKSKKIHLTPDNINLDASASLILYQGKQLNNYVKEKEQAKYISIEQQKQQLAELKLKVAATYYHVQRSQQFRNLLLANLKEEEKRQQQMKVLFKNGVVLRSDLLRAELQISRQQMKLIEVNNTILLAENELKLLLGLPRPQQFTLTDSIVKPQLRKGENLVLLMNTAQTEGYEIKIATQRTRVALFQQKQVQAALMPKVELLANYGYAYPDNIFYPTIKRVYGLGSAGIRIAMPLSALYQNKHRLAIANLESAKQNILLADQQDKTGQLTMDVYVRFNEALKRVEVAEENIRLATENYRIVRQGYFNQLALLTDLLDADTQLLQSKFDLEDAKVTAIIQYYQLLKTVGKL